MTNREQATSTRVVLDNVLFATDFSNAADAALPYALAIARHYRSSFHALHVVPELNIVVRPRSTSPISYESAFAGESRTALEKIRELIPELGNMLHRVYVRRGPVWSAISDTITQQHIDLLVIGTHGRTGIGKLLMESVAEAVLRQAPCPVLTVGPRAGGRFWSSSCEDPFSPGDSSAVVNCAPGDCGVKLSGSNREEMSRNKQQDQRPKQVVGKRREHATVD